MVTLLDPSWIAFYWLVTTAQCEELVEVNPTYVYGFVGKETEVSWPIPNTTDKVIYIRHFLENGTRINAIFIQHPKGKARIQVTEVLERKLSGMYIEGGAAKIMFTSLAPSDAGDYVGMNGSNAVYPGCAVVLVAVGEPLTPTIKPLGIILVKKVAAFVCEHRSTTKPTKHGLKARVMWGDDRFNDLGDPPSTKFTINDQNQLVMNIVERSDKGRKLKCATADLVPGRAARLESQRSDEYIIKPEYSPEERDVVLTTDRDGRKTVYLNDNDTFTCKCEAHCEPACSIQWSFRGLKTQRATNITDLADPQTLMVRVSRKYFGTFLCTASNKHGSYTRELAMVILYLSTPALYINGRSLQDERVSVMEEETVEVKCSTEAVPTPTITLKLDDKKLLSVIGKNPLESLSPEGYPVHEYIVSHKVKASSCEHPNQLECSSDNHFGLVTKKTELYILCSPSRAYIDEFELYEEYIYELDQTLTFSFVIRAVPDPVVKRVKSSMKGESREEKMPDDVEVVTEGKYEDKIYLTKLTLTCRRRLELADSGRIFTLTIEAGNQAADLSFTVRLAGQSTPPNTPFTGVTDVSQTTKRTPRRQPKRQPRKLEEDSSLFAWLAICVLALALGVIIGVAFNILKKKTEAVQRDSETTDADGVPQPQKSTSGMVKESKTKVQSSKTSVGKSKSKSQVKT